MAKEGGLIIGLIVGVAALVISVIIAFVLVSTVSDIETDLASPISGFAITNESGGQLNDTAYTLGQAGQTGFTSPIITRLYNATSNLEIDIGNASLTSAGVLTNGTTISGGWISVLVSYTYSRKQTEISTRDLRYNFTDGIDNVSEKIPTILLIAAVVLILGILALLWAQYQRMNVGGSTSGGGL